MLVLALALATSLGLGWVPIAPGTFGSLAGLVLWWCLPASAGIQLAVITVLFVVGAWSASRSERHFAATDPSQVVIDEVVGMLITLWLIPVGWAGALVGFVLFRFFDVVKPYPANRFEHLPGGTGVMADDAMAAVYANLSLRAVLLLASYAGAPLS